MSPDGSQAHADSDNGQRAIGAVAFGLQPLLLNAVGLFATAFIIRQLGPSQYGAWAVAASLTAANAFFTNLGLRPMFVRSLAESPEKASELLAEQLGVRLVLSLLGGLVALGLAAALSYPPLVLTCVIVSDVGLVLAVTWSVFGDLLQARQRFRSLATATLTGGVVLTAVSVIVVADGGGPIALSMAYVTGPLVTLLMLVQSVRGQGVRPRIAFNVRRSWALLTESRAIAGQQFVQTLRDRAEELLVPKLVGITSFGFFAVGTMPSSRLSQVSDGIATAYYPSIARLRSSDPGTANRQIGSLLTVSLLLTLPLALVVWFLAPALASLLLVTGSESSARVMQITAWSVPLMAVVTTITYSMQASGRHAVAARATVYGTLAGAAISSVLIWKFGIVGASWGWLVRSCVLVGLLLPGFLQLCPDVRTSVPLWRILASGAVAGVVLWQCPADGRTLLAVGGWSVAAVLAYGLALIGLRVVTLPAIARMVASARRPLAIS